MNIQISLLSAALLLVSIMADATDFQVKGYGVHGVAGVTYHYSVANNSPTNVATPEKTSHIEIGRAPLGADGNRDSELTDLPLLYTPPVGSPPVSAGTGVLAMTAPDGWVGREGGYEGRHGHWLRWETSDRYSPNSSLPSLSPGQILTGLSVTRVDANPTYLSSHYRIITDGSVNVTGLIERQDTTPPTLTVTLTPNVLSPRKDKGEDEKKEKSKDKLVPVVATITVQDDYDPNPEIKLESITANEPLEPEDIKDAQFGTDDRAFKLKAEREGKHKAGRIYTVTYSATDGSGNKATARATVTVPHD